MIRIRYYKGTVTTSVTVKEYIFTQIYIYMHCPYAMLLLILLSLN